MTAPPASSIDEKSQIQALDRPHPGLPLKPGKCAIMPTITSAPLFAALHILDGTVLGRCMQKHQHQAFIKFLDAVERAVPADKVIHAILDNYATHKHPKVKEWLADHPRWPHRVATRYDRRAVNFMATVRIAATFSYWCESWP